MKKTSNFGGKPGKFHYAAASVLAMFGLTTQPAQAQVTLDVIGPHEYELPVGFKPFNVFVQYAAFNDSDKAYDDGGHKVDVGNTQTLVGLSKYVRFWTPESHPGIGVAYEIIVPEISVRSTDGSGGYVGGIGDPLTGPAVWFKPADGVTLGLQSFFQIPIGATDVSDRNWKNLSSLFWDWRATDSLGITGNLGVVWQGENAAGFTPGLTYHMNHRLGFRLGKLVEPFLGADAETTEAHDGAPKAWAVDGGIGVMLHTFANQSITLRYSSTFDARNHADNDSVNVKYAYVW
ncbi:transporter [Hydrocarboniphaga effusa]|uniref:transporter n=1 Tax=Hydrocarboniphaga effusa TaxID=243629 RepID=UPI00398C106C